jgi:predicted dehydrogenase
MSSVSRRGFLKTAAVAAGGAIAAPYFIPSSVLGADGAVAAGERLTVGCIGCGIMGERLRKIFAGIPGCQVVAACDVNPATRERIKTQAPGTEVYADFRDLLARKDVDAVTIGTPHHTHAVIALAAARAGKHIYCEKPLTHTIRESRAVLDAVKRAGIVLQVGTHRRAHAVNRLAAELVRNQKIGKLHTIRMLTRPGLTREPRPTGGAIPVPDGYAWDLWLGPAPLVDFCGVHEKRGWNKFSDYSTGEITMTDCHLLDLALWAAEPFLKGPIEIEAAENLSADVAYKETFKYASGVTMTCEGTTQQPLSPGIKFEGSEGSVFVDIFRFKIVETQPATLATATFGEKDVRLPEVKWGANEWWACCEDFVRAVRTKTAPLCPVEGGHRMTVLSDLVWLTPLLKRRVTWDDAKEEFTGDADANKLLHYEYRKPWTLEA